MSALTDLRIFISVGWIVFWLYWIVAAAAGTKRNSYSRERRYGIGLRLAVALLIAALVRLANTNGHHLRTINNLPLAIAGTVLFAAGLAFAVWARRHLGKNWGMPMAEKTHPELVTSGPYRYVRHPIYTGVLTAALATAMAVNLYWLVVLVVAGPYFIFSAYEEEKFMASQFGKTYAAYKQRTKMLIPFVF